MGMKVRGESGEGSTNSQACLAVCSLEDVVRAAVRGMAMQ